MRNRRTNEVLERLAWMRGERIWPNGKRYLWTDAFGVVLGLVMWLYLSRWCPLPRTGIA